MNPGQDDGQIRSTVLYKQSDFEQKRLKSRPKP